MHVSFVKATCTTLILIDLLAFLEVAEARLVSNKVLRFASCQHDRFTTSACCTGRRSGDPRLDEGELLKEQYIVTSHATVGVAHLGPGVSQLGVPKVGSYTRIWDKSFSF